MCMKKGGCTGSKKSKSKPSKKSSYTPQKSNPFAQPTARVTFGRRK